MLENYAQTKWAAVNKICRRYERYGVRKVIHAFLAKWTPGSPEPHVHISADLSSLEDVAKLVSVLNEITAAWPKEAE